MYRLYGIYLVVLPARSAVEMVAVIGGDAASTVLARRRDRTRAPWVQLGIFGCRAVRDPVLLPQSLWRGGRRSVALGRP